MVFKMSNKRINKNCSTLNCSAGSGLFEVWMELTVADISPPLIGDFKHPQTFA